MLISRPLAALLIVMYIAPAILTAPSAPAHPAPDILNPPAIPDPLAGMDTTPPPAVGALDPPDPAACVLVGIAMVIRPSLYQGVRDAVAMEPLDPADDRALPPIYSAYHESGPIMGLDDSIGRRGRVCGRALHSGNRCQTPILVGGLHPDDYGLAIGVERFVRGALAERRAGKAPALASTGSPASPASPATAGHLVAVGLGSVDYRARAAAHEALAGLGMRAAGALLDGAESRDMEVRTRCVSLLGRLLTGPVGEDAGGPSPR